MWSHCNCNRNEHIVCLDNFTISPRTRTSSADKVNLVILLVLVSSSLHLSSALYLAASEGKEDEGAVKWIRVTSKPILEYGNGTLQAWVSSEWSSRIDKSNGLRRGGDLTMLNTSFSTWVMLMMMMQIGSTCCRTAIMPSQMLLLALVLWLTLHPRQWSDHIGMYGFLQCWTTWGAISSSSRSQSQRCCFASSNLDIVIRAMDDACPIELGGPVDMVWCDCFI